MDINDLDDTEKFNLFKELALDIFPIDSWEDREVDRLDDLGLLHYFGLEEDDDDDD